MDLLAVWAKRDPNSGLHHPLLWHLLDVFATALALWEQALAPSLKRQLAAALGLPEDGAGRWLAFLAGLHDIGKASPPFQAKSPEGRASLLRAGLSFPPYAEPVRHELVTAAIARDYLCPLGLDRASAIAFATAIGGHHGVFYKPERRDSLGRRSLGDDRWESLRAALLERYQEAAGVGPGDAPRRDASHAHALVMMVAGLTTVSDWIGSAEESFPYSTECVSERLYLQRALLKTPVRGTGGHPIHQPRPAVKTSPLLLLPGAFRVPFFVAVLIFFGLICLSRGLGLSLGLNIPAF
ncbi:MAG: CRISPR-associated endonuclease Cas3'' [Acetobacteraceae bacterium]|nr:CRISPR-associated endonuclease Cas3'' [Acetobacteraceae bacterium]